MSSLNHKRSIDHIYPLHNKTALIRVDFNVPIKNSTITKDHRLRASLPTIRRVISHGGKAILISHLGRPKGHAFDALKNDEERRRRYLKEWADEGGTGYTTFFAMLGKEDKKRILGWSTVKDSAEKLVDGEGTGKTGLFASLSNGEKRELLQRFQAEEREDGRDDDAVGALGIKRGKKKFPQLRHLDGFEEELSLRPVAERLEELLNEDTPEHSPEQGDAPGTSSGSGDGNGTGPSPTQPKHPKHQKHQKHRIVVKFAEDCMNAHPHISTLLPSQVLLLENVRFYTDETSENPAVRLAMAQHLASYGDYFINDAFATCHRRTATVVDIPRVMGHGCAGYLMRREIEAFADLFHDPPRPMVAIVGGAKVTDKLLLLEHIVGQIDSLVIGGAMAYTFLKVQGYQISNSFHESGMSFVDKFGKQRDVDELAREFLKKAKEFGVEVLLPVDHICHTSCEATDHPVVTSDANVPEHHMALDIGPQTTTLYQTIISQSRTAVWNGPMGVFEIPTYATGSFSIAKAMGDATQYGGLLSIIGGGASARAAEACGHAGRVSHVSSGGGASLDLLEGKVLPGIEALDDL